mmetsp:Transcript_11039/g.22643  ORF Transcript_11039/g.22643 Transcript_11039/m.22643 type:complete len:241 (+) Transcript_11039:955-1677(+)
MLRLAIMLAAMSMSCASSPKSSSDRLSCLVGELKPPRGVLCIAVSFASVDMMNDCHSSYSAHLSTTSLNLLSPGSVSVGVPGSPASNISSSLSSLHACTMAWLMMMTCPMSPSLPIWPGPGLLFFLKHSRSLFMSPLLLTTLSCRPSLLPPPSMIWTSRLATDWCRSEHHSNEKNISRHLSRTSEEARTMSTSGDARSIKASTKRAILRRHIPSLGTTFLVWFMYSHDLHIGELRCSEMS